VNEIRAIAAKEERNTIEGCRLMRNPLNFTPIGTNQVYHFLRRTSTITTYSATAGSFVTNSSMTTFTQNTATVPLDVFVALAFQLSDLPDYTEFTNLFDQYCIVGVQIRISPRTNNGGAIGPTFLYGLKDLSDAAIPSSLQQFREYQTVKEYTVTTQTNTPWTIKVSPRVALGTYAGSVFTGYSSPGMTWQGSQTPTTQHYGLKLAIPAGVSGSSNQWSYDMDFCYHVVCRMNQ